MSATDRLLTLTLCIDSSDPSTNFRIGGYVQNPQETQGSLSLFWFVFKYDATNTVRFNNGNLFFKNFEEIEPYRYEMPCNSISELSDLIIRNDCLAQSRQTIVVRKPYETDAEYLKLTPALRDQIEELFAAIELELEYTCLNLYPLLK